MRNLRLIILTLILVLGGLAACSSANDNNEGNPSNKDNNTENLVNNEEGEASFPVTVRDGNGEEFTMEEEPETIVSLIPSNTEIAYALGLGEKMVAGSDFDNYPEEALELEKIGGMELNTEAILALDPDLILAHPGNPVEGIEQLEEAGLTIYVVEDATNFEEVYSSIEAIAKITGSAEKGQEIIEGMKSDIAAIEEKAEEISEEDIEKVYIEISPAPEIYSPGQNTFEDDILQLIHAENIVAEEGWVMLGEETVIESDPDFIIATYDFVENAEEEIKSRDTWQDIAAVKEDHITVFDPDLVSRPGPRLIEGALELAKIIYPDVFNE